MLIIGQKWLPRPVKSIQQYTISPRLWWTTLICLLPLWSAHFYSPFSSIWLIHLLASEGIRQKHPVINDTRRHDGLHIFINVCVGVVALFVVVVVVVPKGDYEPITRMHGAGAHTHTHTHTRTHWWSPSCNDPPSVHAKTFSSAAVMSFMSRCMFPLVKQNRHFSFHFTGSDLIIPCDIESG